MKTIVSMGLLLVLSGCATAVPAPPPTTTSEKASRQCVEELSFGGGPTDPNSNEVRQGGEPTTASPVRVACR